MRSEEKFASESLEKHLPGQVSFERGEDPPDFYLCMDTEKFAVEVTRMIPTTFTSHGVPRNQITGDMHVLDIVEDVAREFQERSAGRFHIGMFVTGPLINPRRFKADLRSFVGNIVDDPEECREQFGEVVMGGNSVFPAVTKSIGVSSLFLTCGIMNGPRPKDRAAMIQYILTERISNKQQKLAKIEWAGSKWLVLINDLPFVDSTAIANCYKAIGVSHDFNRIFTVERSGSVTELHGCFR